MKLSSVCEICGSSDVIEIPTRAICCACATVVRALIARYNKVPPMSWAALTSVCQSRGIDTTQ